ncbi:hypothetical protein [Desulfothermus sp.]
MKKLCSLFLSFIFLFYGCATIVSKSDYPVSFNTNPSGVIVLDSFLQLNTMLILSCQIG